MALSKAVTCVRSLKMTETENYAHLTGDVNIIIKRRCKNEEHTKHHNDKI